MSLPINVNGVGGGGTMPPNLGGGPDGMMPPNLGGGPDGMMPPNLGGMMPPNLGGMMPPPPLKKSSTGLYIGIAVAVVVVIIIIIIIIVILVIVVRRRSNSVLKTGDVQFDTFSANWKLPSLKRSSNTAIPAVENNTVNGNNLATLKIYVYHIFEFRNGKNSKLVAAPTFLDTPPNPGAFNANFNQAFTVKNFDNKDLKTTVSLWRYLSETNLTGVNTQTASNGTRLVKDLGDITLDTPWVKVISDVAFTGNRQFIEPVQSLVDAYYEIYNSKGLV